MCGLLFILNGQKDLVTAKKGAILEQLLYSSMLRGADATGVFGSSWNGKRQALVKRALPADVFIDTKPFRKVAYNVDKLDVIIGHTRAATLGARDDECAHPFTHKHITLVHNGHIRNHYSLGAPADDTTDVDSDKVAWSFAHKGVEETLKKLEGDFTFLWWDDKEKTFNFIRNEGRPLFFQKVKDHDVLIGGSERGMISWVIERNNLEVENRWRANEPWKTEGDSPKNMGMVFTFSAESPCIWKTKEVELYTPPPAKTYPFPGTDYAGTTRSILGGLGLRLDQKVIFRPWRFVLYPRSENFGVLYGFIHTTLPTGRTNVPLLAMIHGQDKKELTRVVDKPLNADTMSLLWSCEVDGVSQSDQNFKEGAVVLKSTGRKVVEASVNNLRKGDTEVADEVEKLWLAAYNVESPDVPK